MKGVVTLTAVLTSLLFTNPTFANNDDLLILNNLPTNLSFKVYSKEGNRCSTEFGVLRADTYTRVTRDALVHSCPYFAESCMAYVMTSSNCTGEVIAYVDYSGYEGVRSIVLHETKDGTPDVQSGPYYIIFRGYTK